MFNNFRFISYRFCFGIALAVSVALGASTPVGSAAPDFSIPDQYDQQVRLSSSRGKPVLLIYGDRVGSDYMGVWRRAVKAETSAAGVTVIEAANLKAVPHFMQGYVKHKFVHTNAKGQPALPVVLDWEGAIAHSYGFKEDLTNVYLIDANGILRFSAEGKGTPEDVRPLAEAIRALNSTAEATARNK